MKYRDNELYHELALDDSGTKLIDLSFNDPLSALTFQFLGVNGGSHNKSNWMNDVITKIELVDGSDVLCSVSLKELQALHAYQTAQLPYINFEEGASKGGRDEATLFFGRWLWDTEYFMDLTKFSNPQLKITTDEDVIRAMGATGFLSDSFKVSLVAHIIQEDGLVSKGFFMNKEIYNFTSGTSGNEYIELPRDYPISGLMINSTIKQSNINELVDTVKLSCDSDKFVPLDRYVHDLLREYEHAHPPFDMRCVFYRAGDEEPQFPLYYNPRANLLTSAKGNIAASGWQWSGNMNLMLVDDAGAAAAAQQVWAHIIGTSPHCSMLHRFGVKNDPTTYFDPTLWKKVELILHQAAAGAVKVTLQQMRPLAA